MFHYSNTYNLSYIFALILITFKLVLLTATWWLCKDNTYIWIISTNIFYSDNCSSGIHQHLYFILQTHVMEGIKKIKNLYPRLATLLQTYNTKKSIFSTSWDQNPFMGVIPRIFTTTWSGNWCLLGWAKAARWCDY